MELTLITSSSFQPESIATDDFSIKFVDLVVRIISLSEKKIAYHSFHSVKKSFILSVNFLNFHPENYSTVLKNGLFIKVYVTHFTTLNVSERLQNKQFPNTLRLTVTNI